MKILMLTPYLPYPLLSGGQIRTYNLLKKLAKNHQVTLFALIKDDAERQYIPELEQYCHKVKVFKRSNKPFTIRNIFRTAFSSYPFLVMRNHVPETISAVKLELATEKYDLIHAETFYMMPHIPKTSIPTILAEQTIEYLGYESFAKKTPWFFIKPFLYIDIAKIKHWEKYYWQTCTKLIVMSEEDKEYIAQSFQIDNQKEKIEVISNGVDSKWFMEKKKMLPDKPTLLSVGTFKWLPNVEAVEFLIKQVWPKVKAHIPEANLWIVGNAPTQAIYAYQEKDPSITITGGIPDIRDAFNGAHLLVAPVFSGKGTRYKVLEAMASKTPIVATNIAVEGLGVKNREHVLTADTADTMAEQIIALLNDPNLQKKLASNGQAFVTKHYDWTPISQKLDELYKKLGKNQAPGHNPNHNHATHIQPASLLPSQKKMASKPYDLHIIVLNYNTQFWLKKTLQSLQLEYLDTTKYHIQVTVVDNNSTDGSVDMILSDFLWVSLIKSSENRGFSAGNNIALANNTARYVMLLNSDMEFTTESNLDILIEYLDTKPEVGCITPAVFLPTGKLDPACHRGEPTLWASASYFLGLEKLFPTSNIFARYHQWYKPLDIPHTIDACSGAAMIVRQSVIDTVGLLDEDFFMYAEDLDWCKRIREQGSFIVFNPHVSVIHHKYKSGLQSNSNKIARKTSAYFYDTMIQYYDKHYGKKYPRIVRFVLQIVLRIKKGIS